MFRRSEWNIKLTLRLPVFIPCNYILYIFISWKTGILGLFSILLHVCFLSFYRNAQDGGGFTFQTWSGSDPGRVCVPLPPHLQFLLPYQLLLHIAFTFLQLFIIFNLISDLKIDLDSKLIICIKKLSVIEQS